MDDSPPEVPVCTDGNSLLKAVYLSRLRLTRLLLEGGAYINESNERGETPLMVACRTHHADTQSVPKPKMVKYLLESGADPNIQDKTGKTALMHACTERAGVEVLSLLLSSGADPSLEDRSGSSALVHAVHSGDKDALRVLLDACKAKGKEVIIITTDKLPSGRQMTKQYLNVPPPPDLDERLHCTPPGGAGAGGACCMSPSEIQLCTPPHHAGNSSGCSSIQRGELSQGHVSSTATANSMQAPAGGPSRLLHLQRLHSEPWLKIPPALLLLQQNKGGGGASSSLTEEELQDITPEEELTFRLNGRFSSRRTLATSRHHSIDVKDATGLLRALEEASKGEQEQGGARALLSRKMSYDSASPSLLQCFSSHHNLSVRSAADRVVPESLPNLAVSSLRNIVRRRNIGMDHYSSDSQLPQFDRRSNTDEEQARSGVSSSSSSSSSGPEKHRTLVSSRSSTLPCGSRESLQLEALPPQRRGHSSGMLERRGSGALLLDHIAQTRPGYLPPLNPHAPIPDIKVITVTVNPTTITTAVAAASAHSSTAAPAAANTSGPGALSGSCKLLGTAAAAANTGTGGVTVHPAEAPPPPPTLASRPFLPFAPNLPRDEKAKRALLRRHSMQTEQIKQLANFEEIFGQ
ncbi:ankyrin repeat domain 34Bb [Engraulis encrasicolus]|uniref:ankyrin repeat domain 34Bb n=1 Tax=Engraulis encrasicolus TaxID=184585 RepID=UPI002FD38592